jgi:hypothetical protein
MHDHYQLARHRDDRAFVTALGRDPQPDALTPHHCFERTSIALAAS